MEANELRIGNMLEWIRYDESLNQDVCVYNIARTATRVYTGIEELPEVLVSLECLKPIPLTEEWLVKFGFEKHRKTIGSHEFCFTHSGLQFCIYGNNKKGFYIQIPLYEGDSWDISFKYVHKLQNWWHENTGEELTIKNK